METVLTDVIT